METKILINEVHPNPESGSEWIELWLTDQTENFSLTNFTIFDNIRQIYKFSNEQFVNQLLVVEVSGLNNDTDSVILKNAQNEILDSFTYEKSEKGLSWAKDEISNTFILTHPSRNLINPIVANSLTPTVAPSTTLVPTLTPNPMQITTSNTGPSNVASENSLETSSNNQNTNQIVKKYDLSKIKLSSSDLEMQKRQLRLVFIGEQLGQVEVINVIIGSFLIILSASFLLYVKIKNKHH